MTLRIKGATTIKGLTSVNWSPNLLFAAGEQGVWFDPSDFSTMFQDTAGTTPVTATGQSVARINDKSGNNNHATQSTAANRPTLQIDGNGKYYLSFDGSNDSLATSSVSFTATDKVTVWSGDRKLSDAGPGFVAELSVSVSSNNGTFALRFPDDVSPYNVSFYSKGTTARNAIISDNSIPAPATRVFTGVGDISGSSVILRANGAQIASNSSSQGTGNYGNYPLYIGARAGNSYYFNGNLYGLIIRGAASTASQISMTETYMNSKTAAY